MWFSEKAAAALGSVGKKLLHCIALWSMPRESKRQ